MVYAINTHVGRFNPGYSLVGVCYGLSKIFKIAKKNSWTIRMNSNVWVYVQSIGTCNAHVNRLSVFDINNDC